MKPFLSHLVFEDVHHHVHSCLQENVAALTVHKKEKDRDEGEEVPEETLTSALLHEKNQEIDQLNNEIQKLEQELVTTKDSKVRICTKVIFADSVGVIIFHYVAIILYLIYLL